MGLTQSFSGVCKQILIMNPLFKFNKAYSLCLDISDNKMYLLEKVILNLMEQGFPSQGFKQKMW